MSKGNDPAFGWKADCGGGSFITSGGLTKREYFAGLAMQGWLGNSEMLDAVHDHDATKDQFMGILAKAAVDAADGLIAELEKTNDQ